MLALTFQVGPDRVAVDVRRVREVVPRVRLTPAVGRPEWVAGVFVYRGRVVPVIDLHRLTGVGDCPSHLSTRIVLVPRPGGGPDELVGLLATRVAEVRDVPGPDGRDDPLTGSVFGPARADGAEVIRVLDPDRLLALPALAGTPSGGRS
jgi:chemotaxis-related protein WspB